MPCSLHHHTGLRTLFSRRAGTIILPTEQAFEDFLDITGTWV